MAKTIVSEDDKQKLHMLVSENLDNTINERKD